MKTLLFILLSLSVSGQQIISCDDFENGLNGWQFTYPTNHVNSWKVSTAAGNGNSMFVTCDNTNFNYCNATSGTERIVVWKSFNTAQCNGDLLITYNWKGFGNGTFDYGSWGLSNNPTSVNSWNIYTTAHSGTNTWVSASLLLTSNWTMFYNASLKFGFTFDYNSNTIGSSSFAFDNFCIKCFQAPLSLDTTTAQSQTYIIEDNPIIKLIDIAGREITEPKGLYFIVRKFGKPQKAFKL